MVLHPGWRHIAQLVQRPRPGLQDTFQPVQRGDRCQDMRGIGPLRATRLYPVLRVAGGEEGLKEPLAGVMGEQAVAKIRSSAIPGKR